MKAISRYIVSIAVVFLSWGVASAQEKAAGSAFVVAEQPEAPLRISIGGPGRLSNSAMIEVTNNGSAPVKGYVLRVKSTERDHAYTVIMINRSIEPGRSRPAGVSSGIIGNGKPETPELSIDYVEFADGTKWGPDTLGRSKKISEFARGFSAARAKLVELLAGQEGAEFKKGVDVFGGFTSSEPAKIMPNCEALFDRGYEAVTSMLRRINGPREAEAKELARKIELDQINLRTSNCPGN